MSFASTLKTDASPPAWIGDSSGRSLKAGVVQQEGGPRFDGFRVCIVVPNSFHATLFRVIVAVKRE